MRTLELKIEGYTVEVPVFVRDGKNWVALSPICQVLGVASNKQIDRVKKGETIRYTLCNVVTSGGPQQLFCIDIDHIGEWIFGINPNKVKPEIKERMILFRRKLQAVLYAAVTGHIDVDMVNTLIQEVNALKEIIKQQGELIDYLVRQSALNEHYVDKRLASVGGKLLSSMGHKKRKTTVY